MTGYQSCFARRKALGLYIAAFTFSVPLSTLRRKFFNRRAAARIATNAVSAKKMSPIVTCVCAICVSVWRIEVAKWIMGRACTDWQKDNSTMTCKPCFMQAPSGGRSARVSRASGPVFGFSGLIPVQGITTLYPRRSSRASGRGRGAKRARAARSPRGRHERSECLNLY